MAQAAILALNAGSSSLKFAAFGLDADPFGPDARLLSGVVADRDGAIEAHIEAEGQAETWTEAATGPWRDAALDRIRAALAERLPRHRIAAVGHRVVHGGTRFTGPAPIDNETLAAIRALAPLAPLHQPANLAGIEWALRTFPEANGVACFDTAFHRTMPWEHEAFALPRDLFNRGIRRYGFHGLAFQSVTAKLRSAGTLRPRVVLAHLGNGASLCALRDARSIATTMGFTPLDGVPMGTRTGRLDPGILLHLMREGATVDDLETLLNRRSGLLALGGASDMQALEASSQSEAQAAIGYFCLRVAEEVARLAVALGGLDQIVFSGGIGENSARVRAGVASHLEWMGVRLDPDRTPGDGAALGCPTTSVDLRVVRAGEEALIAALAREVARR